MMGQYLRFMAIASSLVLALAGAAEVQAANYFLNSNVMAGGGGASSSSGNLLVATIGQTSGIPISNSSYIVSSGFWNHHSTLSAPVATAAGTISQTGFTANWIAVSGATGYRLDVSADSAFSNLLAGYNSLDVGNVISKAVTGLNNGTGYYYRVRAYSASDTSINSNFISLTTDITGGTFPLAVTKSGSGSGSVSPDSGTIIWTGNSGSVSYSTNAVVNLTSTPDGSSVFSGWSGACTGTGACQVTMSAAKSVSATFTFAAVNGVCGSSNGGAFSVAPAANLCSSGTASATPTGGAPWAWTCSGSFGGTASPLCTAKSTQTITINTPAPLSAAANGGQFTVSATASSGLPVSYSSGSTGVCTNNGATFTMSAASGACIVRYDQPGDSNYAAAPQVSSSNTAIVQAYQLTVTKSGTGAGNVTPDSVSINWVVNSGSANFNTGTVVTLTATPASGSIFAGWSGVCSGTGTCQITMDAIKNVTATFNDNTPPTVSITLPPNNSTQTDVWQISSTATDNIDVASVDYSVMVVVSGTTYYLNSSQVPVPTTTPIWLSATYDNTSATWSLFTTSVNWAFNKTYTITARASDAAGNVSTATSTFMRVMVMPNDPSTLTMDLSSNSIQNNGSITISGLLSRFCSGTCTPINLQNRTIKVTISDSSNTAIYQQEFQTSDISGHFNTGPLSLFNISGSYTVQAAYSGDLDLQQSSSTAKTLLVGRPSGYAVIVQGRISSGEGLPQHTKSTRRVYQSLKDRNFTDDNIYWFNYGAVTDPLTAQPLIVEETAPTIAKVGDIISGTAIFSISDGKTLAQRMSSNPAPLYIIMVDHGSPNQFHMSDGDITPDILDGWLNTLDSKLSQAASAEKKVIIIGACYSGSFIKQPLSKAGRIIIASASKGEVSYRGGYDGQDSIQSGEYFLDELFASFKRLSDIKTAFTEAAQKTWYFTRKGGTPNSKAPFANAAQHPVLDDIGNGTGSIILSDGNGNGTNSKGIYLGVAPGSVNSLADPADLSGAASTIYLESGQTTGIPPLWATALNPSQVSSVYVELLRPSDLLTVSTGTGQVSRPTAQPQAMTGTGDHFEYNAFTFGDGSTGYGKYEAYYYAIDKDTGAASPSKRSLVYRNRAGNNKPVAPAPLEPGTDGFVPDPVTGERVIPSTTLQFQWNAGTDLDGDPLTYTLEVCTDSQFNGSCRRIEEIASTSYVVEGLTAGTPYYWRLWTVDPYSRSTSSSAVRSFTPQDSNPLITLIRGQIIDADNPSQVIAGAQVTLNVPGIATDRITTTKVDGTFEYLGVAINASPFVFSLTVNYDPYTSSLIPVSITPGASINQLIAMTMSSVVVNGVCGSANGQAFSLAPTTNLCASGVPSNTPSGSVPWSWTCSGIHGGTPSPPCSAKSTQTINVTTPAPDTAANGSQFTVAATASSGLTVTYSSGSPAFCTNIGAVFTINATSSGACVVQYDQSGNSNYAAAAQVTSNNTTVTILTYQLAVTIAGTGGGSINGDASCTSGTCNSSVIAGTTVNLLAATNTGSTFGGWSGCDGVNGNQCTVAMSSDKYVTATFDLVSNAKVGTTLYGTLAAAYVAVTTNSILQARTMTFTENLTLNRGYSFTLKGGYDDSTFNTRSGYTAVHGVVTLSGTGSVKMDRVIIK